MQPRIAAAQEYLSQGLSFWNALVEKHPTVEMFESSRYHGERRCFGTGVQGLKPV
jgi:hypothetical protein